MIIEGWTFLDALYMAIITITTIGFKEVHELDDGGRVFTIILALGGVGLIGGISRVRFGELPAI